jgi:hypothetical protein
MSSGASRKWKGHFTPPSHKKQAGCEDIEAGKSEDLASIRQFSIEINVLASDS